MRKKLLKEEIVPVNERIIVAGAGGQGVMLLGKIIAEAAMYEDRHVSYLPAYGAEVRGGTAYCMVNVSSSLIGSPYVEKPTTLIVFNHPSWIKFSPSITANTLVLINSSLVSGYPQQRNIKAFPFSEIALRLGNIKVANMVALGYYLRCHKLISLASVERVMGAMTPADKHDLFQINLKALKEGYNLDGQSKVCS